VTLVAEQRNRVAAAAHLLRYYPDDRAGPAYRDAGEIRWLLYWPLAPPAHRLGSSPDDRAGPAYPDAGEIRWLLYWPLAPAGNPFWPDVTGAAEALIAACADVFDRGGVTRQHADGELPVPGVYGVPEQWPHIPALYWRAGFAHTGHTEVVYLAQVKDLPS